MPIPQIRTMKKFLLKLMAGGERYGSDKLIEKLFVNLILADEKRNKRLPSGWRSVFDERASLAVADLQYDELIRWHERMEEWSITQLGLNILKKSAERLKDFNGISGMTELEREEYYEYVDEASER